GCQADSRPLAARGGGGISRVVSRRTGAGAGVHALAQLLADLEEGKPLRRDVDRRAGARIAALVALVLANGEAAEASDLDAIALLQGVDHRIEDAVDNLLRLALGELDLVGDELDELGLRHGRLHLARTLSTQVVE